MDKEKRIPYFSMEMVPFMEGGLGELSSSFLKSATDLEIPMIGVTNCYSKQWTQLIIDNQQHELYEDYDPLKAMSPLEVKVNVKIEGRDVKVKPWLTEYEGSTGFKNPVIALATKCSENKYWDEDINQYLYKEEPRDMRYFRICQCNILGVGGAKILAELYPDGSFPETIHLNEGHGAFAAVELVKRLGLKKAKDLLVFTTHTPIDAGHDKFGYEKVSSIMGNYLNGMDIKSLAGQDYLNMTLLALNTSRYVNAVSKTHGLVTRQMFPGYTIDSITNGVHSYTWTSSEFQALYDKYLPEWRKDPGVLINADKIPGSELLKAHRAAKLRLIDYVNEHVETKFDPDMLTIGFARRFAEYKRGELIFQDLQKLVDICKGKVQLVFAGKAHPQYWQGKQVLTNVLKYAEGLKGKVNIAFLENYNMDIAKIMTAGSDLWLNLPRRPFEASGTSGMKAAHNGVPSLSTIDGWWVEVPIIDGKRQGGWSVGPEPVKQNLWKSSDTEDAFSLYNQLEKNVLPAFKSDDKLVEEMRGAIRNAAWANSHRMVKEYAERAYRLKGFLR